MRHALCALLVLCGSFALLGAHAASTTPEARGQTAPRVFLPAALSNDTWQQLPTAAPTADRPSTSTPQPTPTPGTPETPKPTPTPGAVAPADVLAVGWVSDPDVAGDGARPDCEHLVVWLDIDTSGGAIWGRFIEANRIGETFLVSADLGAAGPPEVAYSTALERWLVVWPAPNVASVSELRGRIVACPAVEGPVIEIGRYFLIEDQPAVAADGDGFAVVWRRSFSGRPDHQLVGVRVTAATVPEPLAIGDPGPIAEPALACDGTGPCLVAWASGTGREQADVFARTWTPRSGSLGSDALTVANSDLPEFDTSVAWNGSPTGMAYAVAWSVESRYRAVYARTMRGGVLGPAREVDMGLGGSYTPDIAPLGSDVVMAYARRGPLPEWELVRAARFTIKQESGDLAFAAASSVSEGSLRPWAPAVASASGDDILVTWQDQPSDDYWQIVARRASLPVRTPGLTPTSTSTPTATPGTGRYLLVERWTDAEYGPGCPRMLIDFPTYWFNASTGVLGIWSSMNPPLEPGDVGYYASGTEATGMVSGTASGLLRIESVPAAFDDDRVLIASVDDSGAAVLTYAGEELKLAAGGSRRWRTVDSWREPECVVTNTVRITNFGYQDRAKVEYY